MLFLLLIIFSPCYAKQLYRDTVEIQISYTNDDFLMGINPIYVLDGRPFEFQAESFFSCKVRNDVEWTIDVPLNEKLTIRAGHAASKEWDIFRNAATLIEHGIYADDAIYMYDVASLLHGDLTCCRKLYNTVDSALSYEICFAPQKKETPRPIDNCESLKTKAECNKYPNCAMDTFILGQVELFNAASIARNECRNTRDLNNILKSAKKHACMFNSAYTCNQHPELCVFKHAKCSPRHGPGSAEIYCKEHCKEDILCEHVYGKNCLKIR